MPAQKPLQGTELIDCAKANAKLGLETATLQCGYDRDTESFLKNLQMACQAIGVNFENLGDLITEQEIVREMKGIGIHPASSSEY